MRFSTSAFYNQYTDIQVNIQLVPGLLVYQNAGAATIYGADFDFGLDLTEEWTLSGGAAWTHGRYDTFNNAPISNGTNSPVIYGSAAGKTTTRTPDITGNIGANYTHPTDIGIIGGNANIAYNAGYFVAPDNRVKTPSYAMVNGEISWSTPDNKYKVAIWGRNLLNEKKTLYLAAAQTDIVIWDEPITYGIKFSVNF
jgi:iron complex outermembrane receptor protein